jgi:hypothetical protein
MTHLLKSMFIHLNDRIAAMAGHLDLQSMDTPGASRFRDNTLTELISLQQKFQFVLDDGILDDDFFTPNVSILYSHLEEEYREIEQYLFQPISRYDRKAEGYFELVIRLIYKEINFLQEPPYISTMSNSDAYFRAYPKYKIIMLPHGEEKHLLNLGDLYHEIGHLVYMQFEPFLIGDTIERLSDYYRDLIQRHGRSDHGLKSAIHHGRQIWREYWVEELACDLMATYMVGPAYGWSHLKLCVMSSKHNDLFSHSNLYRNHPPDAVRMHVILVMLGLIGCQSEAAAIASTWEDLLRANRNRVPPHYDQLFPTAQLDALASSVFNGCCDIVLRSYPQQLVQETLPISSFINGAWKKIINEPGNATDWTKSQIAIIHSWMS